MIEERGVTEERDVSRIIAENNELKIVRDSSNQKISLLESLNKDLQNILKQKDFVIEELTKDIDSLLRSQELIVNHLSRKDD